MDKSEEGYVYFIYSPDLYKLNIHHIKIGQSRKPEKRLKQLQTGNSFKLVIYKSIKSIDYKNIEKQLHNKYDYCNVYNEWFDMTLNQVDLEVNPEQNQHISKFSLALNWAGAKFKSFLPWR